jgi:hypothetical protein
MVDSVTLTSTSSRLTARSGYSFSTNGAFGAL